jgi:hypothetical protein
MTNIVYNQYIEHENQRLVYYQIDRSVSSLASLFGDAFQQLNNNSEGVYAFLLRHLLLELGKKLHTTIYNKFEEILGPTREGHEPPIVFCKLLLRHGSSHRIHSSYVDKFKKWSDVLNLWDLLRCFSPSLTSCDNEVDLQGLLEIILNCKCFHNDTTNWAHKIKKIRNRNYAHISAATAGCPKDCLGNTELYSRALLSYL